MSEFNRGPKPSEISVTNPKTGELESFPQSAVTEVPPQDTPEKLSAEDIRPSGHGNNRTPHELNPIPAGDETGRRNIGRVFPKSQGGFHKE